MILVRFLAALCALTATTSACNITVAPTDSLRDIADALAATQHTSTADFIICLPPLAIFLLHAPLRLDARHNNPLGGKIVWTTSGDNPATLSAGLPLTKWRRCAGSTRSSPYCPGAEWNGVWVHFISDIPNATAQEEPFRQLWVDGARASRTLVSAADYKLTLTSTGYVAGSGSVGSDWATNQVEFRWPSVIRNWIEPRCLVAATAGNNISISPPCWATLKARTGNPDLAPVWIENTPRVPGPGEFFTTPTYLFYRPVSSHPYAAPTNAVVATSNPILQADGIQNHVFSKIRFTHSSWRIANQRGGYVPSQTEVTNSGEPRGAVEFTAARNLTVELCAFEHIGAAYALSIGAASQAVSVTRSSFTDLSGGAIKLGNVNDTRALSAKQEEMDSGYQIEDCLMQSVAVEFRGAACIFAGYVRHTNIAHNTIANTGYTGISLGWGWGSHVKGPQTFASDNHITANHITGVMSALNDGGCTYTLGPQPRSSVTSNYCGFDHAPVVGAFYHDNGSRYFKTKGNVAESTPAPCVYLQGCCNSPAYDIAVSDLWCRDTAAVMNGCAPQNCTIDPASLHIVPPGTAWPPAAQAIISAAGRRPSKS